MAGCAPRRRTRSAAPDGGLVTHEPHGANEEEVVRPIWLIETISS